MVAKSDKSGYRVMTVNPHWADLLGGQHSKDGHDEKGLESLREKTSHSCYYAELHGGGTVLKEAAEPGNLETMYFKRIDISVTQQNH